MWVGGSVCDVFAISPEEKKKQTKKKTASPNKNLLLDAANAVSLFSFWLAFEEAAVGRGEKASK